MVKGTNLEEIDVDDKGVVKGGADLVKKAKTDYADLATSGESGVPQLSDGEGGASTKQRAKFY